MIPLHQYVINNDGICDDEYEIHTMVNEIIVNEIKMVNGLSIIAIDL